MFHSRDGLFFEKLDHGDVRVTVRDEFSNVKFETVLGCSSLASMMAAMCNRGYTSDTFYAAYEFLKEPPAKNTQKIEVTDGD